MDCEDSQPLFANGVWTRPFSEIGEFRSDVLTAWSMPSLSHCIKPELLIDASRVCREIQEGSIVQEDQVLEILRGSLVGHTCIIEEDPPWPNAYDVQIENNKCRFVRDTSPPCPEYTVKITGVELVGSRGQGTQLLDSDIDVVALVILEGCKNTHQMKEHFLSFGHRQFATSLFTCLCQTEAVEVSDTYPHKNRTSCSVAGLSVDVLPALPPESLSLEDLRMCEPGVWIKTYSLNLAKTQWVSRQPEIVRNAARLLKLWARAVCHQESIGPLRPDLTQSWEDDYEKQINTHALTIVLAALQQTHPSDSALELCAQLWMLLTSLRVDLLVLVSFDTDFSLKFSRGPRFHQELAASFNWQGLDIIGLAIEDIMQPDRLYRCSETIRPETLATYAACACSRLLIAENWSQMTAWCEKADPCLKDVFDIFVPSGEAHFSHFRQFYERYHRTEPTIICPGGHKLLAGVLQCKIFCDDCGIRVDATCTVGCQQCDFDLCKDCADISRFMSSQFPVPFQKWPLDAGPSVE